MHNSPPSSNENKPRPDREEALAHYFGLRDKLVSMRSDPEPNLKAIDALVHELEQAQLAYKATYVIHRNNPNDDRDLQARSM